MTISVIVPVYNVEKYLRQCLDSLLQQTYKDIEVILIDDGSTDASGSICDEYAARYDNFQVIHKENAGLGMARNTGLDHISGEYVAFVDSDDYLDPGSIEALYKNLKRYGVDMCKGGFRRVLDSGKIILNRKYDNETFLGREAREVLLPRMIGSSPFQHDSVEMCVWGALYNAAVIKQHEVRFPSERELISEDLVFNIDYMQYARGACLISDVGYNYRVNSVSLSTSYRQDRFEASKYFYLEMQKKCVALGYDQQTLQRLDRMFYIYVRMSISQEKLACARHGKKESLETIRKICSDDALRESIANYPLKCLPLKQRIFLRLIQINANRLLLWFAERGIL